MTSMASCLALCLGSQGDSLAFWHPPLSFIQIEMRASLAISLVPFSLNYSRIYSILPFLVPSFPQRGAVKEQRGISFSCLGLGASVNAHPWRFISWMHT